MPQHSRNIAYTVKNAYKCTRERKIYRKNAYKCLPQHSGGLIFIQCIVEMAKNARRIIYRKYTYKMHVGPLYRKYIVNMHRKCLPQHRIYRKNAYKVPAAT